MVFKLKRSFLLAFLFLSKCIIAQTDISVWLTNNDRSALFLQQPAALNFSTGKANGTTIFVDDTKTFQQMDGFGFALTGGSAMHIIKMNAEARSSDDCKKGINAFLNKQDINW